MHCLIVAPSSVAFHKLEPKLPAQFQSILGDTFLESPGQRN